METVHILPGRFQPFHNDHMTVVRKVINQISGPLIIGVIVHSPPVSPPIDDFELEARKQNSPERNPFTPLERLSMIADCLRSPLNRTESRCHIVLLPRPEAHWDLIKALFPHKRIWVIPDSGEDFDEMKATFFARQKDEVLRVVVPATTDGRMLRSMMASKDDQWTCHVPQSIARHVENILRRRLFHE